MTSNRFNDDDRPRGDDRSMRDFRRIADKEAMQKRALGEAAAATVKRLRMRRFTWCRAENAVYDDKKWRRVARMAGAPLHLVEAFILRLDLHASAGTPRGTLDPFVVEDLAAHWGLANEDVLGRIYAALEHPDIGWIEGEHLVTFWPRNPDTEDTTAADRTHRSKAFKRAMKMIADYARCGQIDGARRLRMEKDLFALRDEARRGHFPRGELLRRLELLLKLSTDEGAHDVSAVTSVSLTTRSDQKLKSAPAPVENRRAMAADAAEGLSEEEQVEPGAPNLDPQQQALLWLETEGVRIVTEQLQQNRTLAATRITRWRDQELGGDAAALVDVIRGAERAGVFGLRFLNLVVDGIRAARIRGVRQVELPLPPVPVGERKLG